MKLKKMAPLAMLMGAFAVAGVPLARAQSGVGVQANIPFAFYAGGERMPAGTYRFELNVDSDTATISNATGRYQMFLMGVPTNDQDVNYAVMFDHSGDHYYLTGLDTDGLDVNFPIKNMESGNERNSASAKVAINMNHA